MDPRLDAAIDLVEASYDLDVAAGDWLPNVLRAGESLLDLGMGCYGAVAAGYSEAGVPVFTQVQGGRGAEDLPLRIMRAAQDVDPELVARVSRALAGTVYLLCEAEERWPIACEAIKRHVGCEDVLSLTAVDPDGHGVNISMPAPKPSSLDRGQKERWQMLAVHLAAGHRLRRGLGQQGEAKGAAITEIPLNAEALIDPKRFLVSHAIGDARSSTASNRIREAARLLDRARGPLRRRDPEEALRLWQGLVRGKWTLVDWFDSDGRRFVLAKPNAPHVSDPRGLSEREAQIATYAALGETSKIIGYRLGLSQSYVSRLLNDAMRKLSVKTQAQLVEKMRGVQPRDSSAA